MSPNADRALSCVSLALLVTGCLDGPFARANPYDPKAEVEMRVVAPTDTLRGVGTVAEFTLETTPHYPQYPVQWSSTQAGIFENLGNGVFRVRAAPPAPVTVTVSASWELRRASTTVVVAP